jgi:hypothetical protein
MFVGYHSPLVDTLKGFDGEAPKVQIEINENSHVVSFQE